MKWLVLTCLMLFTGISQASVSILTCGAKPDGNEVNPTDNSAAFKCACDNARKTDKIVDVPYGSYATNSFLAEGVTLRGILSSGNRPRILTLSTATGNFISLATGSRLENLEIDGSAWRKSGGGGSAFAGWYPGNAIYIPKSLNVEIKNLWIRCFQVGGVLGDNLAHNYSTLSPLDYGLWVHDSFIDSTGYGVRIDNCERVRIQNNSILKSTSRGIFAWGEDLEKTTGRYLKSGRALTVTNNIVKSYALVNLSPVSQEDGIEIHGTIGVTAIDNVIEGASDIGLDVEWCDSVLFSGNSVSKAKNGGIATYFSCTNVMIANNYVKNDYPRQEGPLSIGIWVTKQNRSPPPDGRPYDYANQDIRILDNYIDYETPFNTDGRLAILVQGNANKNVVLSGNRSPLPDTEQPVLVGYGESQFKNSSYSMAKSNFQIWCVADSDCVPQTLPLSDMLLDLQPIEYRF